MAGAADVTDADRVRGPGPADRDPARAGLRRPAYHDRRARRAMGGARRPAQLDGGQRRRPVHAARAPQFPAPEPPGGLQPRVAAAGPGGGGRGSDRRRGGLRPRPGAGHHLARALPQRQPGQQRPRQPGRRGSGAQPERAERADRCRAQRRPERVRQPVAEGQLLEFPQGPGRADRHTDRPHPHGHALSPTTHPTDTPTSSPTDVDQRGVAAAWASTPWRSSRRQRRSATR